LQIIYRKFCKKGFRFSNTDYVTAHSKPGHIKTNKMKNNAIVKQLIFLLSCCSLASCQAIGDIFKAGVWSGVLLVAGIIALIIFIISRVAGKK
jgi:hypothetical protein